MSTAFHNTTAIVGAGVLGLPYAMKYYTWSGGIIMMILAWVISLYTLKQLVAMHEMDGAPRPDSLPRQPAALLCRLQRSLVQAISAVHC